MRYDPHDPHTRLASFEKDEHTDSLLTQVNSILEAASLQKGVVAPGQENSALIYVVGAPRSGTTLLHQLIARHLEVGYIDNVVARFWGRPSVGIVVSRSVHGGERAFALKSTHGVTSESSGPHEFGYFWRRWLPLDRSPTHHLDETLQASVDFDGLRNALREEILRPFARSVVFKNVICGFHAALLTRIHPNSIFVHITREPEAAVRSILAARIERYGSVDAWWSLKPSTYPFLNASPVEEVVRQVLDSRAEFETELSRPGVRAMRLEYRDLCHDPNVFLEELHRRVVEGGSDLEAPTRADPLRSSMGPRLSSDLEAEVGRRLA